MPGYLDVARAAAPAAFRRAGRIALGRRQLLNLVEMLLEPVVLVTSLWGAAVVVEGRLDVPHLILGLLVFSLTYPSDARLAHSPARVVGGILLEWLTLSVLLLFFGWATRALAYFDTETLVMWWLAAPWCQIGAHYALRAAAPVVRNLQGGTKRAVLAGLNSCGIELMRRFAGDLYSSVRVVGYVDDRGAAHRQQRTEGLRALGTLE